MRADETADVVARDRYDIGVLVRLQYVLQCPTALSVARHHFDVRWDVCLFDCLSNAGIV